MPLSLWVGGTLMALVGLLLAEWKQSPTGRWAAKPLASSGFIATALAAGALESRYGRGILTALGFSFLGDLLLIRPSKAFFLVGLLAFLVAHLAFALAFALRSLDVLWVGGTLLGLLPLGWIVLRSLLPRVEPGLGGPVVTYAAAISLMVASAAGTVGAAGGPGILFGAVAFYLSDFAVALERFVRPGLVHRLWGLPLYYGAQLLLAASAGR